MATIATDKAWTANLPIAANLAVHWRWLRRQALQQLQRALDRASAAEQGVALESRERLQNRTQALRTKVITNKKCATRVPLLLTPPACTCRSHACAPLRQSVPCALDVVQARAGRRPT